MKTYSYTKNEVEVIAKGLMVKHGSEFAFDWNKRRTSFGLCSYTKKTIFLSEYLINRPLEDIIRTVLHEIAHELVGHKQGHNYIWKSKFRELCNLEDMEVKESIDYTKEADKGYKYHLISTNELGVSIRGYRRKPNRNFLNNIDNFYVGGDRSTKGTLQVITREEFVKQRDMVSA